MIEAQMLVTSDDANDIASLVDAALKARGLEALKAATNVMKKLDAAMQAAALSLERSTSAPSGPPAS